MRSSVALGIDEYYTGDDVDHIPPVEVDASHQPVLTRSEMPERAAIRC